METAAIVLAGGHSNRMGMPKASLEWHRSTLLHRICGVCARCVTGPVIVVAASGQELPRLPARTLTVTDAHADRGPLEGLATGLAAAAEYASVAFVSATDTPFLTPAFIRAVLGAMREEDDIVLPEIDGFPQPLSAAYAISVAGLASELVAAGRLQFRFLFARCAVRRLDRAMLTGDAGIAAADPGLDSIISLDQFDEYRDARARPAPAITIERTGTLIRDVDQGARAVRAATLAAAASAAGVELGPDVAVIIGETPVTPDPELPLVEGDEVVFTSAPAR